MAQTHPQTMTSGPTNGRSNDTASVFLLPDEDHPYWRSPDGQRLTFLQVVAGQPPAVASSLATQHAQAVRALVRTAAHERLGGRHMCARKLASAAARLCEEACGLWPPGSWLPAP